MKTTAHLRHATAADLPAIRSLLAAAGLPADDLERAHVEFVVAVSGAELNGVAGAEALAPGMVLLRSFAVPPGHRGRGIGGELLARLLADGRREGVKEFYLLTMTASAFFAARGFSPLPREQAPAAVRAHPQFAGLCPQSATLMRLVVSGESA